jgi:hypothetical protein
MRKTLACFNFSPSLLMVLGQVFQKRLALFLVVDGRLPWLGRHGVDVQPQTPATSRNKRKLADFDFAEFGVGCSFK